MFCARHAPTGVNRDRSVTGHLVEHDPMWSVPMFTFSAALGDRLVIVPVLGPQYVLNVARSAGGERGGAAPSR